MSITTQLHWKDTKSITLQDAEILANILIDCDITVNGKVINLRKLGWRFHWSTTRKAFGMACYQIKEVWLSHSLTKLNLNNPQQIENTIRHEIAHALKFAYNRTTGHDEQWRRIFMELGGNGERCYDGTKVNKPIGKYRGECPNCGRVTQYYKTLRRAHGCGTCCNEYNNGKFHIKFKLQIFTN